MLQMQHFEMGEWFQIKKVRKTCWKHWCSFVRPLGVEPCLQDVTYQQQVWCLTGFAACACSGRYGQGKQVAIVTVSGALLAVVTTVALAYEGNPTKAQSEKTLLPRLAKMMEGWRNEDPPTKKDFQWELMYQNFWHSWGWKICHLNGKGSWLLRGNRI